ncbi:MAG TPA: hypothetical protein VJS69_05350 [Candidatus Krumholzibacteria bacterium]|nr:hypothetical protein [Candidatus Krumholzibacteria bacterium]
MENNSSNARGSLALVIGAVAGAIAAGLFVLRKRPALARETVVPTGKKI